MEIPAVLPPTRIHPLRAARGGRVGAERGTNTSQNKGRTRLSRTCSLNTDLRLSHHDAAYGLTAAFTY